MLLGAAGFVCGTEQSVSLTDFAQDLGSSRIVMDVLEAVQQERQAEFERRYADAVDFYYRDSVDYARLLALEPTAEYQRNLDLLTQQLLQEMPRPQTEAYRTRLDALIELQVQLGVPRQLVDGVVAILQQVAASSYSAEDIEEYFAEVDRLRVEAPRSDDLRTWRFLLAQDVSQQLVQMLSHFGPELPLAMQRVAAELSLLDQDAGARLEARADYLQQSRQREDAARDWVAGLLESAAGLPLHEAGDAASGDAGDASVSDSSAERSQRDSPAGDSSAGDDPSAASRGYVFSPGDIPVTVQELGRMMRRDPLLAVAVSAFRLQLDPRLPEYQFFTNVLRTALGCFGCGFDLVSPGSPRSSALLDQEYLAEYERRSHGLERGIRSFQEQAGRSWRTDPHQRTELMGSRLTQRELDQEERAPEVVADTLREWGDGARIPGARMEQLSVFGLPAGVLLVEPDMEYQTRLERTRATWLQDADVWEEQDAVPLTVRGWFLLHGLVVIPTDPDNPLWDAGAGELARAAAREYALAADNLAEHTVFSETFRHILMVEAAVRMVEMWHVWLQAELDRALQTAGFSHPDAFLWYGKLQEFLQQLETTVQDAEGLRRGLVEVVQAPLQWDVHQDQPSAGDWEDLYYRVAAALNMIEGGLE
ncbi:hypothetical protein Spiaf_1148 [Spirochaeta africana DSM 8902]|uniref:Uncharacterized protein n=2 Tax=Spirochaeta TaxID=146 RepID=H9UI84_SPIAZ|nr:hypothetical protein Spiaf_1148 [Spirochaeta africana DSM 8902]